MTLQDNTQCPQCGAPLGTPLGPSGTAPMSGAVYDPDDASSPGYDSQPCLEKARGSRTISIARWGG